MSGGPRARRRRCRECRRLFVVRPAGGRLCELCRQAVGLFDVRPYDRAQYERARESQRKGRLT